MKAVQAVSDLPPEPPRTLRLNRDPEALAANWRALDRLSGKAQAGAAVKADAYGLGADWAVPLLRQAGACDFFVAHWSEVPEMLQYAPAAQISVLHGPLSSEDVLFAVASGVRPVINSLHQAMLWLQGGGGICDVMVDTGINRLGVPLDAIQDPLISKLEVDMLMSHLACADEDSALNQLQLDRFGHACAAIPAKRRSMANSAGIALGKDYAFDVTRPGLALYGGMPREELAGLIRPVAGLEATIIQTRDVAAGDGIGYNASFTAPQQMRIAIVSLGYADGFLRSWGAGGYLLYGETRLKLLGKVSMDMIAVDLTNAPGLSEGEWLEVPYSLPEAAAVSGLSQYELLTILGHRFAR